MKPRHATPMRNSGASSTTALPRFLRTHRKVAHASLRRILGGPISSSMTICVIAVSLLLPALLISLNNNLSKVLTEYQHSARITLYLHDTVNETSGLGVSKDLLTNVAIESTVFVSSAQALMDFGVASGLTHVLAEMESNPLPASIIVAPADTSPDAVAALVQHLQRLPEVDLVQVDSQWLQRLAAVSQLITVIGRGLIVIVVFGLFFIVGNTIRLAIENRRDEIRVIKLVGGTDAFVARPFLYTGLFYGLAGGLLAALLQVIVLIGFNSSLQDLLRLYESSFELQGFDIYSTILLILAGGAIGWAGAMLASLRHIVMIDP